MEVQAHKADMFHGRSPVDDPMHFVHADTEFVLRQARSDMGMRMHSHVRIDTQCHTCDLVFRSCQFVDDFQFRNRFHVEAEDAVIESRIYFPVGFSHAGEDDFIRFEAGLQGRAYLASAYAIGT